MRVANVYVSHVVVAIPYLELEVSSPDLAECAGDDLPFEGWAWLIDYHLGAGEFFPFVVGGLSGL